MVNCEWVGLGLRKSYLKPEIKHVYLYLLTLRGLICQLILAMLRYCILYGFIVLFGIVYAVFGGERVKRGGFGGGGYGSTGGYAYSSDLLIGSGVGGNLAYDSNQRNLFAINAADLGMAFNVGDYANSVAKATRTSAAAGSKFKGGYGR